MEKVKCTVSTCKYYTKSPVTPDGVCSAKCIQVNNCGCNSAKTSPQTECQTFKLGE